MAVEVHPLVLLVSFAAALLAPTLTVYLLLAYRLETGLEEVRNELREHAAREGERVEAILADLEPTASSAPSPVRGDPTPAAEGTPPALPGPGPQYLIVDDSGTVRDAVEELLVQEGVEPQRIHAAATASEALELVRERRPEVVLLDADLPDMDGLDVAEELGSIASDVAIVAISDLDRKDSLARALEERACRYVEKPVNQDDIADLDELIAQHAGPGRDPETPEPD